MAKCYGVRLKHRLKHRLSNKFIRANRGRTRHTAINGEQYHANNNERLRPSIRAAFIRTAKRAERNQWRNELATELFEMELGLSDPEFWLYSTNLTTFKDTRPKGIPHSHLNTFEMYERDLNYQDYDESYFCSDFQHDWDSYILSDDCKDYNEEPQPVEAKWRDMWVAGVVHDNEGRDLDTYRHNSWYEDMYGEEDEYDYWEAVQRRFEEQEALKVQDISLDVARDRDMERHRAGERYFRQNKRTVLKPPWSGTPFEKKAA